MKLLSLSWGWHDEYFSVLFVDNHNTTEQEWDKYCKQMMQECGEEYIKQEEGWISAQGWVSFCADYIESKGKYKRIYPTYDFDIFGEYIIGRHKTSEYKKFKEIIGESLMQKAENRNSNIQDEIDTEVKQRLDKATKKAT